MSKPNDPLISEEDLTGNQQVEEEDEEIEELIDVECQATSGLDIHYPKRRAKYKSAMKSLIPIRLKKSPKDELPEAAAGFFSLLTYAWLTPIMWKINRKGTEFLQHMRCPDVNRAEVNAERLERIWRAELKAKGPEKASFARVLLRAGRTRIILGGMTFIISMSFSFAAPAFVLRRILDDLLSGNRDLGFGIGLVVLMAAMEFSRSMFFALGWVTNYTTGLRMRGAVLSMLYGKILRLRGLKDKTVGELVNICSNDGQRLYEAFAIGPLLIGGPVILLYGIIYTVFLIGPWALVGSATYLMFYPFMAFISKLTALFRRKGIVITDKRVRMMTELLNCIKLIKMYAWEKSFAKTIAGIRSQERAILEKAAYVNSISTSVAPMVPVMASVFVITAHVMTGNPLNAAQAFTMIAVFNAMRFSLGVIPYAVKALADVYVSTKRCKSLLMMEEIQPHTSQINNPKYAVVIKKASFSWDQEVSVVQANGLLDVQITVVNGQSKGKDGEREQLHKNTEEQGYVAAPTLKDIDLVLEKGKLLGVCGSVGSGKSSLISAILGRMVKTAGKVAVSGNIAYVSQQPWILNATIRENILFGEMYHEDRYNAAIEACCLREDLETFVSGEDTEIGERGINLSGGQKQRLALARALYADKDIYLMDDPLSAVDIHVGRHIFTECLIKGLKKKTVLFVTHQLQYLSSCDGIIVITDGEITERGKHEELMQQEGEYASLINRHYKQQEEEGEDQKADDPRSPVSLRENPLLQHSNSNNNRSRTFSARSCESELSGTSYTDVPLSGREKPGMETQMSVVSSTQEERTNKGRLVIAEETSKGKVTFHTYRCYMKAAGGFIVCALVMLVYIVSVAVSTGTSWWLSYWLQQGGGNTTVDLGNNVTVKSMDIQEHPDIRFYALVYGMGVIAMVIFTLFRALLFMKVTLHASSKLHDKNFLKILRCPMSFFDSTPIGRIVNRFSFDMDEIDVRLPGSSEVFIMNILMIIFALISIAYVSPYFLIALLPLAIAFFGINFVFTSGVRELKRMDARTRSPLISHITATVQGINTIHAFGKSTEFMDRFHQLLDSNSVPFFLFSASNRWLAIRLDLLCVIVVGVVGLLVIVTNIPPALAGMALAFSVQMTGLFQFTVRMAIETEARFTSVERLAQYEKEAESEAPNVIKKSRPPDDWPHEGSLVFKSVKLRYRDNLPLALKGVSFDVLPREKIGIVGRSGSGKSSLGVSLFRLVELESGSIKIDNLDISTLGLQDLRSKLSIIPQDPVLFIGTIRYNLDPFGEYNDAALWSAIEKCHIKETITSLEHQLDSQVIENGENFSVGERQLICLARALLRHSKILMLDEATAAIDTETDALVQTTIKEAFSDCTMLIIAHRLNTVLSCSRILVMEEGKVVEFDTPGKLMSNSKSKFKMMLDATENHKL
ncbi:ATP-binding cassette sub-family C member 5-like [Ostrea edulis]|uniref:ATP-binding cassette sub-family C member 5-like n=1 Tax=Ostrea edulis TaxID=37623 RepID=UPI0024AEDBD6|nr:ATP-binding cassette sub-family C member 5-like [Ostrea edulis]XP_056005290.1 ATP-binding cassette sub-family C member 5-like [Ostrea edulis]